MSDLPTPSDRRSARIIAADTPSSHGLLFIAVVVVVIAGLYLGRSVLIPITLAILLSFLLAPLVNLLRRLYFGRVLSVLVSVLLALTAILALGGLIGTQLAELAEEVPRYAVTIQQKVDTVQQLMLSRMTELTQSLSPRKPPPADQAAKGKPGPALAAKPSAEPQKPVPVEVHQPDLTPIELAQRIVTPVVEPLSTTAIVLIVSIFILLQREDLRDRVIRLFGSSDLHRTTLAMDDAAQRLSRFLLTQLAINATFGVVVAIGLSFIGIPSPVMWGVLGALLRFVPYVGAPLSGLFPLVLAAAIDPGWYLLLWTASLYIVVEVTLGQVVEPLLYGHSTGLSPFAVVVAATFWTWLWGPIGLILSTPLTLCLMVLGRHVTRLEFLDVLLGDSPALTPVQSFYQRILAGDPDEAHDQAEVLLKECALADYYDDVVLNGLQLIVNDVDRGVLSHSDLALIKMSIDSLIEDLEDHDDEPLLPGEAGHTAASRAAAPADGDNATPPSTEAGKTRVLCIAGRGPLDEQASAILAQLLSKHGLAPRVVPHAGTSRAIIGALDVSDVAMVCITSVAMSGSPSHLRYLVRRLRARLRHNVPMLVGFWREGDELLQDERLRAAVGADYYTSTLREAVEKTLQAVQNSGLPDQPQLIVAEA
jgi:predicted PurR-regulated permease PerM